MLTGTITLFGRRFAASPRTVKIFLFIVTPLLLCFALTTAYFLCQALAIALGIPVWAGILLVIACTLELSFNDKTVRLLPAPLATVAKWALVGLGLYVFGTRGPTWKFYWVCVFAAQLALSTFNAARQLRQDQQAQIDAMARGLHELYGKPPKK